MQDHDPTSRAGLRPVQPFQGRMAGNVPGAAVAARASTPPDSPNDAQDQDPALNPRPAVQSPAPPGGHAGDARRVTRTGAAEQSPWYGRIVHSTALPLIVLGVMALSAGGLVANHFMGSSTGQVMSWGGQRIVVFDPVKFLNAQRAAASILAARPNPDLAFTMTQVARQAEAVIRDEADGAVVVVKQAVVLTDNRVPDITDAVLRRFGLPTDVPTVDAGVVSEEALESYAPSNTAFSRGRYEEDRHMENVEQAARYERDLEMLDQHSRLLP